MHVYMSVVDLPELRMYWCKDKFFGNFGIADVMPRLRFEKLSQYFHANDRTAYNRGDPNRDKLHLIRPIMDVVLANCLEKYNPHRDVAIDEAMVKFRGVLGFRQYMPAKPTKYGIKVWARADSANGFVSEFEVYVGRPNGGGREVELGRKVVSRLTEKIRGKNHHVYFDNYFNGVKLHQELIEHDLYGCGTVRANASGLPERMKVKRGKRAEKLDPGESKVWQKGKLVACLWQEKPKRKPVKLLSSNVDPTDPQTSVKRKQKDGSLKDVPCPTPVKNYNERMDGVDRADQMRTAYSSTRTSKRWWTYLFWFLVDLCISNSLVLMRESKNHKLKSRTGREKERSLLDFRKNLAVQLLGETRNGRKRKRAVRPDIFGEGHWPKKVQVKGRCKNCTEKGTNGQSRFICTDCSDEAAGKLTYLCVLNKNCFQQFHERR
eukprot:Seg3293.2 transcript_id=Seg3293.2/GoldUCD/mRNA.D3Y31 product="PiggyBac transposable element-derived protein 4" protein_id=Seg3293.2/GoldUCD/D3Y31